MKMGDKYKRTFALGALVLIIIAGNYTVHSLWSYADARTGSHGFSFQAQSTAVPELADTEAVFDWYAQLFEDMRIQAQEGINGILESVRRSYDEMDEGARDRAISQAKLAASFVAKAREYEASTALVIEESKRQLAQALVQVGVEPEAAQAAAEDFVAVHVKPWQKRLVESAFENAN